MRPFLFDRHRPEGKCVKLCPFSSQRSPLVDWELIKKRVLVPSLKVNSSLVERYRSMLH